MFPQLRALTLLAAPIPLGKVAPAAAQDLGFVAHGNLPEFDAGAQSITTNGVGGPTVTFNAAGNAGAGEYLMLFETRFDESLAGYDPLNYPNCNLLPSFNFVWGIGRATSPDGLSWTLDAEPVLVPDPASTYKCALLQPSLVFDGTTYHVFYIGADIVSEFQLGTSGFDRQLFHATSSDGQSWTTTSSPDGVFARPEIWSPSVTMINGEFHMMIIEGAAGSFKVYGGTSPDGDTWTFDFSTPIIDDPASWTDQEVYSPAGTCDDDELNGRNFQGFIGGRTDATQTPVSGVGFVRSPDFFDPQAWSLLNPADPDAPLFGWNDGFCDPQKSICLSQPDAWLDFDALRVADAFVLYSAYQPGGMGPNRLEVYYSTPTNNFDESQVRNRVCMTPPTVPSLGPFGLALLASSLLGLVGWRRRRARTEGQSFRTRS